MTQLKFFLQDVNKMLGSQKIRILYIWLSRVFLGVFIYRFERSLYLIFKKFYIILRIPFIPIINILQAYSNIDIHYQADVKGGLLILHPSCGIVISRKAIVGENTILTGGNIIGINVDCRQGDFVIGNGCYFGANATVIGPLKMGNKITVGASACVTKDCLVDSAILKGVPARMKVEKKV